MGIRKPGKAPCAQKFTARSHCTAPNRLQRSYRSEVAMPEGFMPNGFFGLGRCQRRKLPVIRFRH
ncbi:hypothetical protein K443DRAFT_676580 [Laccaria amethystina LaAM-08-1]|uniref:Uncharacterized protein n=1 Tax=Laccaria amethystina LaAM-08-1 TaxID=1095629 RepID=A0A0C9XFN0_9AGAR|nr:hypothetical protein K443DRAFT_676580 [Laccaria amethystina LaAM-08-1]